MQMMVSFSFPKLSLGPLLSTFLVTAELVWKMQLTDKGQVNQWRNTLAPAQPQLSRSRADRAPLQVGRSPVGYTPAHGP